MYPENIDSRYEANCKSGSDADMLLKGGTVLNVYSGELLQMDVATKGERIFYIGSLGEVVGDDTAVIDVSGKILVPGYIEPHSHPWVLYNPVSFGQEAIISGTTTCFCDSLYFYLLMGLERFEFFMETLASIPIKLYWTCRTAPQSPLENEEKLYSLRNLKALLKNPNVASLGEITRWPDLLEGDARTAELIDFAGKLNKRVDAHTAGAKYEKLNVLSRSGMDSCHESINGEQLLDRLRLGLYVMLRHSSLRQDLPKLINTVVTKNLLIDRMMLTTDGSTSEFHQQFGMNDNLIRMAVQGGIDPISAYRMATINPAVYFGMDGDIGGIAPGRFADVLILESLGQPTPEMVISKGRVVSKNGTLMEEFPVIDWKAFFSDSCFTDTPWKAKNHDFKIPSDKSKIRFPVIRLISAVITSIEWHEFIIKNGYVDLAGNKELSLIALINKHGKWVTNGIIRGFSQHVEGLASSFNTAAEILAIGNDPEAISAAVNRVLGLRGGIVAFEKGKIAYELKLPFGGIMSDEPVPRLAKKEKELKKFLSERGYPYHDPLYTFTFLPNDFLPEVRINYDGIVDVKRKKSLWNRRKLVRPAPKKNI